MAKKWYSYFVVTDDKSSDTLPSTAVPDATRPSAAELVRDVEPMPALVVTASSVDLAVVYQSAKIEAPAHGYTVLKVADMLESEHLQALSPEVKRKSILVALDAAGVSVEDIVRDAVQRDRALDTYERVLEQHVAGVKARVSAENQQIEAEIASRVAELRRRIEENSKAAAADEAEFTSWLAGKRRAEATIAEAVSYFVTDNPITTTAAGPASGQGEGNVR